MKLYTIPGACSLASNIALREACVLFEVAIVDWSTKQASDGKHLNHVNPKGYVPALSLDDGQILTENVAVLSYIDDRFFARSEEQLMRRFRLLEWLCFINSELHKGFSPLYAASATNAVKHYAREQLTKRFDWLQSVVCPDQFLFDDRFTVADAYMFTVLSWGAEVDLHLGGWPALDQYYATLRLRPAIVEAMRSESLIA